MGVEINYISTVCTRDFSVSYYTSSTLHSRAEGREAAATELSGLKLINADVDV